MENPLLFEALIEPLQFETWMRQIYYQFICVVLTIVLSRELVNWIHFKPVTFCLRNRKLCYFKHKSMECRDSDMHILQLFRRLISTYNMAGYTLLRISPDNLEASQQNPTP